jgi:hypothetical protein
MTYVILENLSITTKIESLTLFDLGKPSTKFIDMSTQRFLGTGKGAYKL